MIEEIRLPEISDDVETGDVIKLLVEVGEVVTLDQPLVELETDKAVLEVPSPTAGTITEILVAEGDTVNVNQVMFKLETESSEAKAAPAQKPAPATEPEPTPEPAPAPAAPEAAAPAPAVAATAPKPAPAPVAQTPAAAPQTSGAPAPASPSLRRLARELGVDIGQVRGSGPGGRILKDDLKAHARNMVAGAKASAAGQPADDVTESTKWGPIAREPMSKVRAITARAMTGAWQTIPHVTQYDRVDITEMEELRKQYSKRMELAGGKLTMTAILLKVAASALKVFPQFNASVDMEKQEVIYKRYYHIGVAVDTERGLLVPVIRQADKKNITELSNELNLLAERTRNKKVTPEELDGGTFTISNLGGIGGTNFSPIVYPPQVAILGVSRASIEPVYINGAFEPRLMLPLSVSYDHRVIDGADAARFLRWVVEALEEPLLLALEG